MIHSIQSDIFKTMDIYSIIDTMFADYKDIVIVSQL